MGHTVGIDLGTTNSVIAYTEFGRQRAVKVEESELTSAVLPSCIALKNGELTIGAKARRSLDCVREVKRGIGTDATFQLGAEFYGPVELSAMILSRLKQGFESAVGPIEGAVITVPANFTDRKRAETREAGRLAGLKVLRLINEPSAAAIAYARSDRPPGSNAVIIDWGGGTLDVSLIDCLEGVLDVRANDGEERCGGADLDDAIFSILEDKARHQLGDKLDDRSVRNDLMNQCEAIKIHLSSEERWDEPLNARTARAFVDFELTRTEFEQAAIPHVNKVLHAVKRCLDKAPEGSVRPEDVTDVILVGGSCNIPLLKRRVAEFFGQDPRCDLNPMEVVSMGAAYQAEHAHEAGDLVTLHSLTHALGVSCAGPDSKGVLRGNMFAPILEATSKLPAKALHTFSSMNDDQESIMVQVYEAHVPGETVDDMVHWDSKSIDNLPPGPAGSYPINIAFDYNIEQQLTVHVEIPGHGISERWTASHQDELESTRGESESKLSALGVGPVDALKDYAESVRSKSAVLNTDALEQLRQLDEFVEKGDADGARSTKAKLAETLFDLGISL
tara:strand:- start:7235 stop:8917 length:1683 start_codon:yes stop_codon:yes gene_type:complete